MFTTNSILTYTGPLVRLEGVPEVTPTYRAVLCILTGVLTASVAMVTCYCGDVNQESVTSWRSLHACVLGAWRWARTDTVSLVPGQLESWTTLTGHAPFGGLLADVGAAMLLIHTTEAL